MGASFFCMTIEKKSLSQKQFKILRELYKESEKSPHPHKYAALVLSKNQIISRGHNDYKSGAFTSGPKTMHAEIAALTNLGYHSKISLKTRRTLKNLVLIVGRRSTHFKGFEDCKPCRDCQKKIQKMINSGKISKAMFLSEQHFDF